MISKLLSSFDEDKQKYEATIENCTTEDEEKSAKNDFSNILKLYLFEANNIIKETFSTEITPFKKGTGYNALYKDSVGSFSKKTKDEFNQEIKQITSSATYVSLDESKKKNVDNAIYIISCYHENNLL